MHSFKVFVISTDLPVLLNIRCVVIHCCCAFFIDEGILTAIKTLKFINTIMIYALL